MPMKYVAFFVFIWIVGSLMGAVLEQGYLGPTETNQINAVLSFQILTTPVSGQGYVELPKPNTAFFSGLWQMATFNFKFLQGEWLILKWIIFGPLIAMVTYAFVLMFINLLTKAI